MSGLGYALVASLLIAAYLVIVIGMAAALWAVRP